MSSPDQSQPPSEPPALAVRQVRVTYPARRGQSAIYALRSVDLMIQPGQTIAMLGPNGSGKSTLMRVICGLMQPGAGSVSVFGSSSPQTIRRNLGVVFQHTALDPQQVVREALLDQARLYGISTSEAQTRVRDDLARANLADRADQSIKTLSLGLARRVDLVRAMLHRPRVLLLDEPTVGLDPTAREAFLQSLERQRSEQSLTILLSTHLTDEADRQDRVVLMHEGRIVADDSPTNLRRQLGSFVVTVHDGEWSPPDEQRDRWHRRAGAWVLPLVGDGEAAVILAADLTKANVAHTIAPPTLADLFEHLTGRRLDQAQAPPQQEGAV